MNQQKQNQKKQWMRLIDVMIKIAKEVEENPGCCSRCTTYNDHWKIRRGSSSKKPVLRYIKEEARPVKEAVKSVKYNTTKNDGVSVHS